MDFNAIKFKKLDLNGLKTLVDWAKSEGWNPGPNDAKVFWATDPDGYFGYFLNGEMIGGGSVVSYTGDFGFMGFRHRPQTLVSKERLPSFKVKAGSFHWHGWCCSHAALL